MLLHRRDKKYTGCNLKTTKLLDCVLIEVCAVIKLITYFCMVSKRKNQRTDSPKSLLACKVLMECCVSSMQTQYMQRR